MGPVPIDPAEYHRENRCPKCRLTRRLCMCAELPEIDIPFELVVLQHILEGNSLSNTGSLAARMLRPSRLLTYRGTCEDEHRAALEPPGLLLYPVPGAVPLTPAHLEGAGRLVVLDATWRRARRMYRKTEPLRALKTVTLPHGIEPRWVLRRPPAPGMLSTVEAIAGALEALGLADAAQRIHVFLDDFMPRALHITRKIRYSDVPRSDSM